jgi:uncharacterized UPF0160 family protein
MSGGGSPQCHTTPSPRRDATRRDATMNRIALPSAACELPNFRVFSLVPRLSVPDVGGEFVKVIGTHSGSFHADEALATAMLTTLPAWKNAVIVRTRDPQALNECDIVVDVGGVYDPSTLRFDHHQREFVDTLSEEGFKTKLSSAGLVYRHYGREFIRTMVGDALPSDIQEKLLYKKLYKDFVEAIDGNDNGVEICDGPRNYSVHTALPSRVSRLNPDWMDEGTDEDRNERFKKAMALTLTEMQSCLVNMATSWWPARSIVEEALARAKMHHPSGEVVLLEQYCPWKGHLFDLEKEQSMLGHTKFVVYPEGGGNWRVQGVPLEQDGYALRVGLAEAWRGVRNEALSELSGIPGCIFVHTSGFIGGNASREGALQMAIQSLGPS